MEIHKDKKNDLVKWSENWLDDDDGWLDKGDVAMSYAEKCRNLFREKCWLCARALHFGRTDRGLRDRHILPLCFCLFWHIDRDSAQHLSEWLTVWLVKYSSLSCFLISPSNHPSIQIIWHFWRAPYPGLVSFFPSSSSSSLFFSLLSLPTGGDSCQPRRLSLLCWFCVCTLLPPSLCTRTRAVRIRESEQVEKMAEKNPTGNGGGAGERPTLLSKPFEFFRISHSFSEIWTIWIIANTREISFKKWKWKWWNEQIQ